MPCSKDEWMTSRQDLTREQMLRSMTNTLVKSHFFAPGETDRMKRVQAAYDLACALEEEVRFAVMADGQGGEAAGHG